MGAGQSRPGAPREEDIKLKMMEIYALKAAEWRAAAAAANNIGAYVRTYRRGLGDAIQRLDSDTKDRLRRDAIRELTAEASAMRNTLGVGPPQNETPRNTLNRKLAAFYDAILGYKANDRAQALEFLRNTLDGAKKEWKKDRKSFWKRKLGDIGFKRDELDDTHSEIIEILVNTDPKVYDDWFRVIRNAPDAVARPRATAAAAAVVPPVAARPAAAARAAALPLPAAVGPPSPAAVTPRGLAAALAAAAAVVPPPPAPPQRGRLAALVGAPSPAPTPAAAAATPTPAAAAAAAAADINIDLRGAVANEDMETIIDIIGDPKVDPDEKGTDGKSALDIANDLLDASVNKGDIIDLLNEKARENTGIWQAVLVHVDDAIATIQNAAVAAAAANARGAIAAQRAATDEASRIEAVLRRVDLPNRFTKDIDDALARIALEVGKVVAARRVGTPAAAAGQYNDAATTDLGYAMEDIENNPGSPRNAVIDQGIIPRLRAGADPNAIGGSSQWPFIVIAAFANNTRAVQAFVDTPNINVNAHEAMGQTALWHAARNGNVDMIRILAQNDELRLIPPDMVAAPNPRDVIKGGINAALRAEITAELDQIEDRDGPAVAVAPVQQFVAAPQPITPPVLAAPSPKGLRIAVPPNSNNSNGSSTSSSSSSSNSNSNSNSTSSNSNSTSNSSPRGRRAGQKLFGAKPPPFSVAQMMANGARKRIERRAALAAPIINRRAKGAPPMFTPPPPPPPPQGPAPPGFNNALRTIRARPAAQRAAAGVPPPLAVQPPAPPNLNIDDEYNNPLDFIQTDGGYKHRLASRKARKTRRKGRRTRRTVK